MAKVELRCSLAGSLRNAADALDELWRDSSTADDDEKDDPERSHYYAFVLREIAGHAEGVASGEHTLEEFAEPYCLTPRKTPEPA